MVDEDTPGDQSMFRLYLIADRRTSGAVGPALRALPSASAAVQLRDRELGGRALSRLASELLPVCRAAGAPLLVNDRADVAVATGAGGVHLPAAGLSASDARALLGPGKLVGASCHSIDELRAAAGADFAVFGPVWATPGKGPPLGIEALRAAAAAVALPVFALGGVDAGNARAALDAGAAGVACIRAVLGATDPAAAAARLWEALGTP